MTVTKVVVRGILLSILAGSSSQGGTMLFLGVTAGDSSSSPVATAPTITSMTNATSSTGPSLSLGVFSNSSTSGFQSGSGSSGLTAGSVSPTQPQAPPTSSQNNPAPAASPSASYDAFINLGSGPYPNAGTLTNGNALPWSDSATAAKLFGGSPSSQQISSFDSTVIQRVQQTFSLSGVPVSLTTDPHASAAHTLSVVSNTVNPSNPSVIGMTYIGSNGFHYIDNSASSAQSVDQLEWIVAHNVAHELMLAFGVPENYDKTGQYIDATTASWGMMTSPTASFSPAAAQALLSRNFQDTALEVLSPGAQFLDSRPVPEPATLALWTLLAMAGVGARKTHHRRASATA